MTDVAAMPVVFITGAARGIGAETARRFAEDGFVLALADRDEEGLTATADELREVGVRVASYALDVVDVDAVAAAFEDVGARFGRLDVLVNNAGITRDDLIHKMTLESWDDVIDVHLKGAFLCAQAAQRLMVPRRYGKIVSLSSTSALGNRGQANYAAAKAGIQGLTRTLAIELGPFGINVNAVAPGFVETDMTRATAERIGLTPAEHMRQRAEHIPLRRVGVPRDIANVIRFLCSDEASYVSGQVLYVRGGP